MRLESMPDPGAPAAPWPDPWPAVAAHAAAWARDEGVVWRDAVLLVPFLEVLAPARRAFAAFGPWMPRIETTQTLAASLGPPPDAGSGETGFNVALDTLVAMQVLSREKWGADWSHRDRRGFERGAARIVTTAHDLARAAAAVPPAARAAWWQVAREALEQSGGPGGKERLLARIALEWACAAPAAATDRLFDLRPSAWIVIEAGGADPLAASLLAASEASTLVIDTDAPLDDPFAALSDRSDATPAFGLCDSFEDEAAAAAAQVLEHLVHDERPVALVAQDRLLVRRIRALLERQGARLADETGWKLATTRAGASVMAMLVAARPMGSTDGFLEWLKSVPLGTGAGSRALAALESASRKAGAIQRDAVVALSLDASAQRLRADALAILRALATPARRGLPAWLDALRSALDDCGALADLRDDAAGRQALVALSVDPPLIARRRHAMTADLDPMSLAEFTRWVDDVFERVAFRPPDSGDASAEGSSATTRPNIDVVVTPLARAMLRPFAALVLPGADDQHLGAPVGDESLLPRSVAEALGIPGPALRRDAELLSFAQALRVPRVTLLRRRGDATEPIAESPVVERLRLALADSKRELQTWRDPRVVRRIDAEPVRKSAPSVAAAALPQRLSAGAFEALRACPYRFFARSVLRLGQAEELDDVVEKRDYGSWLHGVLHRFHVERDGANRLAAQHDEANAAAEVARLFALGEEGLAAEGLDAVAFLPFSASFAAFAPRYIAWLHERERRGWSWSRGEADLEFAPPELDGIVLHGRIDRIDDRHGAGLELIDYKTGSAQKLKDTVSEPFEDTQLAFYAALVGAESDPPLKATYLALDGTRGLEEIEHRNVSESATALVAGAAAELHRLRGGAAMPPLGEGSACEYCDARGLCRRDHWNVEAPPRRDLGAPR
ncbi:MAG: PD-(D/E)XK nuclease family protein [Caldimonas sp.]